MNAHLSIQVLLLKNLFNFISILFLGIPVVEIAMNGHYSMKTYLQHSNGIGPEDLNDFTLCLRFSVNYLKPHDSYILHYSSFIHDNSLQFSTSLDSGAKMVYFQFCKYFGLKDVTTVCIEKTMKHIRIHDMWHHACWLFKTDEINLNEIIVSTKIFLEGQEVNKGRYYIYTLGEPNPDSHCTKRVWIRLSQSVNPALCCRLEGGKHLPQSAGLYILSKWGNCLN